MHNRRWTFFQPYPQRELFPQETLHNVTPRGNLQQQSCEKLERNDHIGATDAIVKLIVHLTSAYLHVQFRSAMIQWRIRFA